MRSRSRDTFAQLGSLLLVALLTIPGLIIYLLIRPRETLSEAYERSLEEEALLQEIEEKPTCPGCGQRVTLVGDRLGRGAGGEPGERVLACVGDDDVGVAPAVCVGGEVRGAVDRRRARVTLDHDAHLIG